jgi:hypothetical protein
MYYNPSRLNSLNSLSSWRNPVYDIKDPLKQRWAEIVQTMSTHIEGVCPLHIYVNRRPLESQNTYAIEYRVNNYQPLTKDAFDRSLNGIIENCQSADIGVNLPDLIQNNTFTIHGKDIFYFCNNDLVRLRETDPNAVIVVVPKVTLLEEQSVSIDGVEILLVLSSDIEEIEDDEIEFCIGRSDDKHKILFHIEDGQYTLKYPDENGKYTKYPIVKLAPRKPYIHISDNVVYEGKYKLRLPYLFGAAAWGDKFYGQESDFSVQATRYTYLKEIRAKEKCDEIGYIFSDGKHIDATSGRLCGKCQGTGFVKDDSPLGTIYVDYSKLNSEERAFPQVVQWSEPPQAALTSSKEITDTYFERMTESLGLVKQNFTNQSGVSKGFDFKEKISTIYKIFYNNISVLENIYKSIEYFLVNEVEQVSQVYLVGEIGKSSVDDVLVKLSEAKKNQAPASLITSLIDQLYQKTLSPEYSDLIIKTAKYYDKLYIYGSNEIATARAQLGNSMTEKDIIIHNTVVDVLNDYIKENGVKEQAEILKYLDDYYSRFNTATPTATTLGIL